MVLQGPPGLETPQQLRSTPDYFSTLQEDMWKPLLNTPWRDFSMLYNIYKHETLRLKEKRLQGWVFHVKAGGESPGCSSHTKNLLDEAWTVLGRFLAGLEGLCSRKAPTRLWLLTGVLVFVFHQVCAGDEAHGEHIQPVTGQQSGRVSTAGSQIGTRGDRSSRGAALGDDHGQEAL